MLDLLDIRQDYIFKLIFAHERNKKILIGLLNAILKDKPHVYDIEIQNPEIPRILKGNKTLILDIKAKIGEHSYCNIEMQSDVSSDTIDRGIQYLAGILSRHAERAPKGISSEKQKDWDYSNPKVIGIWIMGECLNYDYGSAINEAVMTFKPNEMRSYQIISDKIRLFTIELPKFNPQSKKRRDMLDNWLAFFKNPLDSEALQNEEINTAFETLKELSEDENVRQNAEALELGRLAEISARNAEIKAAVKAERARAEEEKLETAKSLLNIGLSVEQISQCTKLPLDIIECLKQ